MVDIVIRVLLKNLLKQPCYRYYIYIFVPLHRRQLLNILFCTNMYILISVAGGSTLAIPVISVFALLQRLLSRQD